MTSDTGRMVELNIAIIDAEIIGKKKHRFPNLACLKLSAYHKHRNHNVTLKTDWSELSGFDKVYISKVFTKTIIPDNVLSLKNVNYGGSGFFFDNAPRLPNDIEHIMPDYTLYDDWITNCIAQGAKASGFSYYRDYSIGLATRGCFRRCGFCINRNSTSSIAHSPIAEFHDPNRKKICLLDDNLFACADWKDILYQLQSTGKRFKFRQGLDLRLLDDEKCVALSKCKYDGDIYFAFDNLKDAEVVEKNIKLLRHYCDRQTKSYVLCGYDSKGKYDQKFWANDVSSLFERVKILGRNGCLPYLARYERYKDSPYSSLYSYLNIWINYIPLFTTLSFMEWCDGRSAGAKRVAEDFLEKHPELQKAFYERHYVKPEGKRTYVRKSM